MQEARPKPAFVWLTLEEIVVRQIVLIRWTPDATEDQKQQVAEALLSLREVIPQVRDTRLGTDIGVRDDNFDFAVSVDFDTRDDYLAYREHPEHQRVVTDTIRPVMAERAGVVFESV